VLIAASVSSGTIVLVGAVFLASCVETVEALTIVFPWPHSRVAFSLRGQRRGTRGLGRHSSRPSVRRSCTFRSAPCVSWSRRTPHFRDAVVEEVILRATGLKAKHDEDAIYEQTVAELRAAGATSGRDRIAFVMAFKGSSSRVSRSSSS